MEATQRIREILDSDRIVLFMKGTPQFPQCGFSSRTVEALKACGSEYSTVDVLQEPDIRANLPAYSQWPTFPQLFIGGELIGGCDIVMDLFRSGELQDLTAIPA
jgi:monothiol glutaredoxin